MMIMCRRRWAAVVVVALAVLLPGVRGTHHVCDAEAIEYGHFCSASPGSTTRGNIVRNEAKEPTSPADIVFTDAGGYLYTNWENKCQNASSSDCSYWAKSASGHICCSFHVAGIYGAPNPTSMVVDW